MPRDFKVQLQDILDSIGKIREYVRGLDYEDFHTDGKTVDSVVRNLEIIGEAARNLPEEFRRLHPHIEWRKITELRNILIHQYFGVDLEIIWDIIENKLPALEVDIAALLERYPRDT